MRHPPKHEDDKIVHARTRSFLHAHVFFVCKLSDGGKHLARNMCAIEFHRSNRVCLRVHRQIDRNEYCRQKATFSPSALHTGRSERLMLLMQPLKNCTDSLKDLASSVSQTSFIYRPNVAFYAQPMAEPFCAHSHQKTWSCLYNCLKIT